MNVPDQYFPFGLTEADIDNGIDLESLLRSQDARADTWREKQKDRELFPVIAVYEGLKPAFDYIECCSRRNKTETIKTP